MNPDPDDVSFEFNQIQLSPEVDDDVTFGFNQVNANDDSKSVELTSKNDDVEADVKGKGNDVDKESDDVKGKGDDVDKESDDVDEESDDVEDEEFTFTCLTEKTVITLFDQSLLYNNFNNNNEDGKRITTSSSTTLTASTNSNEINIKSNSTGFTNLRRCGDNNNNNNINRSKSDGRDAFGFLNPKARVKKEVVKKKVEKPTVSALEEYLRRGEEKKRKSYLPYSHIRRRPAQLRPYGITGVLYASIKKSLRVASNILPS